MHFTVVLNVAAGSRFAVLPIRAAGILARSFPENAISVGAARNRLSGLSRC